MADAKFKFTPGPWFFRKAHKRGWYIGVAEVGWNLADTCIASDVLSEADGVAIAATPDLIIALQVARETIADGIESFGDMQAEHSIHDREILAQIDAALAKALA